MKTVLSRQQQPESYSFMEIMGLTAFRPNICDHAYPLEQRLRQHRVKEFAVLAGDGSHFAVHLLTRDRKGTWASSALSGISDIGARPVVGVFSAPEVPAVLRIAPKSDAVLANILAVSPRKAMVEGVGDDSMRVQSVRLGNDRHVVWRIQATALQRFERPIPTEAPLMRVTHGLASVVRLALEGAAGEAPDAILCGDHQNFIWLEIQSGRPSEAIRPREVTSEEDMAEWLEHIAYDLPADRPFKVHVWVSPFSWMQDLPSSLAARLPKTMSFEMKPLSLPSVVFA